MLNCDYHQLTSLHGFTTTSSAASAPGREDATPPETVLAGPVPLVS